MLNVTIITGLLVDPYAVAHIIHLNEMIAGCIGIAAVFAFNALGHFAKTDAMISMLPSFVPGRRILIHASGILEILFAIALLAEFHLFAVGFGGHSMGPRYLLVRLPLQILLVCWVYWFTVRGFSGVH